MEISDTELRKRLEAHNYPIPPITITTRHILQKKLAKLDKENNPDLKGSFKSAERFAKRSLKSTPSVTFNQYEETIEGEEGSDDDAFEEDEADYTREYLGEDASDEFIPTLDHRDFMAEQTRYRKNKDQTTSRFQSTTSTPPVNSTLNILASQHYPREIYTTERRTQDQDFLGESGSNKGSTYCNCKTIWKLIIAIAVSLFFVILYEYLTRQSRKNLIS